MIMEVMVALVLLSIIGLAVAKNSIMAMVALKRGIRNSVAMQLATEKLEQLGSVDPTTLANTTTTESALTVEDITFSRVSTVSQNTDGSKTVTVTVTPENSELGQEKVATSRFPLWGNK